MELTDSGKSRDKQPYSEPKLVEHGDIAAITMHLFGPRSGDGFRWSKDCRS